MKNWSLCGRNFSFLSSKYDPESVQNSLRILAPAKWRANEKRRMKAPTIEITTMKTIGQLLWTAPAAIPTEHASVAATRPTMISAILYDSND